MVLGIQIIGIVFAIGMIFLTYLYYRRKDFNIKDFSVWMIAWVIFLIAAIFPNTLNSVLESLRIYSVFDVFIVGGFIFITSIVFYLYRITRRNQKKLEKVVKKIALKR